MEAHNPNNNRRKSSDTAVSQPQAKKQKKQYVYPVFEKFEGWRHPTYEGGIKESSTTLIVIMTKESEAKQLCSINNVMAEQKKRNLEDEVGQYDQEFLYQKEVLNEFGSGRPIGGKSAFELFCLGSSDDE